MEIKTLTCLRFLLAIWVILFHLSAAGAPLFLTVSALPVVVRGLINTGYLAVELFFVLSGFLLGLRYSGTNWTLPTIRKYVLGRIGKIYPVHCLGLLMLVPFSLYSVARSATSGIDTFFSYCLASLLIQAWVPSKALVPNPPAWSLAVEVACYALFPILLRVHKRAASALVELLLAWGATIVPFIIIRFVLAAPFADISAASHPTDIDSVAKVILYNPIFHVAEFYAGIAMTNLWQSSPEPRFTRLAPTALFLLCGVELCIIVKFIDSIPLALLHNGLLLPLHCGLILLLAKIDLIGSSFPLRVLLLLGRSSYSLYILQVPAALWLRSTTKMVFGGTPTGALWSTCYLFIVVGLSILVYHWFEEPVRKLLVSNSLNK